MNIVLVGLNHRTASVDLREQMILSGCSLRMALDEIQLLRDSVSPAGVSESVILSTCNRLEVYGVGEDADAVSDALRGFLSRLQNIPRSTLEPHLYTLVDEAAVNHLLRVAAGLDSMILGEPQILGQVTTAFETARGSGVSGPVLSHLFTQAAHAGKRARTETAISQRTTSISHAAALLVSGQTSDFAGKRMLVIGAGEMAELAAKALHAHGAKHIAILNRTYPRAQRLAAEVGGEARGWNELHDALVEADAVITATGAPHIILYPQEVSRALSERQDRPLLLVDIAVPRDVDEAVAALPGVTCHDIDDLQHVVDDNLAQRQACIPAAEAIVSEETQKFMTWLNGRAVVPVIVSLRRQMEAVAEAEVQQALGRLEGLDANSEAVINRLAHRIVNKLLHEPTVRLKEHAASGDGIEYARAVRQLFALEDHNGAEGVSLDD